MCVSLCVYMYSVSMHMSLCICVYVCVSACVFGASRPSEGEETESLPENLNSKVGLSKASGRPTMGDGLLLNGLKARNIFVLK